MAPDDDRRVDSTFSKHNMAADTIQHHQILKPRIAQYGRVFDVDGDGVRLFIFRVRRRQRRICAIFIKCQVAHGHRLGDVCPCCRDVQHFAGGRPGVVALVCRLADDADVWSVAIHHKRLAISERSGDVRRQGSHDELARRHIHGKPVCDAVRHHVLKDQGIVGSVVALCAKPPDIDGACIYAFPPACRNTRHLNDGTAVVGGSTHRVEPEVAASVVASRPIPEHCHQLTIGCAAKVAQVGNGAHGLVPGVVAGHVVALPDQDIIGIGQLESIRVIAVEPDVGVTFRIQDDGVCVRRSVSVGIGRFRVVRIVQAGVEFTTGQRVSVFIFKPDSRPRRQGIRHY